MKRLSITLSLISNPYILLLDEPTSGLDSAATMGVMAHIQSLANKQGYHFKHHFSFFYSVYIISQPDCTLLESNDFLIVLIDCNQLKLVFIEE